MFGHIVRVAKSLIHEAGKKVSRSDKWPTVEHHFKAANPTCAACGSNVRLQIHHQHPFHLHPELELDPANLISLCMGPNDCHILIGHGDNFKAYNPDVLADAAAAKADPTKLKAIQAAAKTKRLMQ
jgi:hypothetical protein